MFLCPCMFRTVITQGKVMNLTGSREGQGRSQRVRDGGGNGVNTIFMYGILKTIKVFIVYGWAEIVPFFYLLAHP